jgi:osmotically-inducible protein OsmY
MIVVKTVLVPVRLLFGTARVSARAGFKTARAGARAGTRTVVGSAKMGYAAGRAVGVGRTAVFGAGVTVGVLVASPKARAAVGRVASTLWSIRARRRGQSDDEIGEEVRRRLAGGQATWDLPQPMVTVQGGQVRLDGDSPDAASRRAVAEAASAVDGVREVDNRIVVVDPGPTGAAAEAHTFDKAAGNGAGRATADGSAPGGV